MFTPDRDEGSFTAAEKRRFHSKIFISPTCRNPREENGCFRGRHIMIIFQYYGFRPCSVGTTDPIVVTSVVMLTEATSYRSWRVHHEQGMNTFFDQCVTQSHDTHDYGTYSSLAAFGPTIKPRKLVFYLTHNITTMTNKPPNCLISIWQTWLQHHAMTSPSATEPSLLTLQSGPLKVCIIHLTLTPIVDCMPEVEVSPGAGVATTCPVGRSVIGLKLIHTVVNELGAKIG